jgi:hypothetical protein
VPAVDAEQEVEAVAAVLRVLEVDEVVGEEERTRREVPVDDGLRKDDAREYQPLASVERSRTS